MAYTPATQPVIRSPLPLSQGHPRRPRLRYQTFEGEGYLRPPGERSFNWGSKVLEKCGESGRRPPQGGIETSREEGYWASCGGNEDIKRVLAEGIRTSRTNGGPEE